MLNMKNGIIKIEMFEALDSIRNKYKDVYDITDKKWAEAAWGKKNNQSRISELRTKARNKRQGNDCKVYRAFSFDKCMALLGGLIKIIGTDLMSNELKKLLERAKTPKERMLLLVMAMKEPDEDHSEMYLRRVVLKDSGE